MAGMVSLVIEKPQFDTDTLRPGRVLKVKVINNRNTAFPYNYEEYAIIIHTEPFNLKIIDQYSDTRSISLYEITNKRIEIEVVA